MNNSNTVPNWFIPGVGLLLYGSCDGYFGRSDDYCAYTYRVEAIGNDWVVVRETDVDEKPSFAYFDSQEEMHKYLFKWSVCSAVPVEVEEVKTHKW